MAGFTSFASTAMQALSVANTVAKGIDNYKEKSGMQDYEYLKRQSDLNLKTLQQENDLKKQEYDQKLQADQDKRRRAVLQAIAKQKAEFGASGIGSGGGSAQAYLLGLSEADDAVTQEQNAAVNIQKNILDQKWEAQKSLNTLALTEAKERSKLRRATSLYDGLTSIF